jgi:hypothetical protein
MSADALTVALEVSPVGNGVAVLSPDDLSALWQDYAILHWAFRGAVPPKSVRGADPRAGLMKLAKLVLVKMRLGVSGTIAFKDKDVRNLRRDNLYTAARRASRAEETARARYVAEGLLRVGFRHVPMPDEGAEVSPPLS